MFLIIIRRLRPILFRKNSAQEYWGRWLFVLYSRFLMLKRDYACWQKRNEYNVLVEEKSKPICFLQCHPEQEIEKFQQELAQCSTEWVLIAAARLRLAPFALQDVSHAIAAHPQADLIYSDGDWLDNRGQRIDPWMKPVFGTDSLRSQNYIAQFFAVRKSLGDSLGWLNPQAGSAWAEDLVWRVVEQAREVIHIPKVLYHRVTDPALDIARYSQDENRVIGEHLQRMGQDAQVEAGPTPHTYRIHYKLRAHLLISIIIPSHELASELRRCVESILEKTTYQNFEILLVENNSQGSEIFETYRDLQSLDTRVRLLEHHHNPFNFAEINNVAASKALGEVLLFLNNDTEIISPDWLERMLEYAQRPNVGAVGVKMYYPQGLIQHVGMIVGMHGSAGHTFANYPRDFEGYHYNTILPQNYSAVTAACMMTRREVFEEVGGFDAAYRLAFNDIDLCLKMREKDYLIVWTPYAELYHHESLSRGYDSNSEMLARFQQEKDTFINRWKHVLDAGDPYYNPNLALDRGYYSLRPGKCDHTPRSVKGLGYKPKKDE